MVSITYTQKKDTNHTNRYAKYIYIFALYTCQIFSQKNKSRKAMGERQRDREREKTTTVV